MRQLILKPVLTNVNWIEWLWCGREVNHDPHIWGRKKVAGGTLRYSWEGEPPWA